MVCEHYFILSQSEGTQSREHLVGGGRRRCCICSAQAGQGFLLSCNSTHLLFACTAVAIISSVQLHQVLKALLCAVPVTWVEDLGCLYQTCHVPCTKQHHLFSHLLSHFIRVANKVNNSNHAFGHCESWLGWESLEINISFQISYWADGNDF